MAEIRPAFSLGKGEVESSILSGSTSFKSVLKILGAVGAALFSQPIDHREHEGEKNRCHRYGKDEADIVRRHPAMIPDDPLEMIIIRS
jgi:hypothetical protein